jgi:hypothetical protein
MDKFELAINPSTQPDVLIKLSTDDDWRVRRNVALNRNTTPEMLEKLAVDEELYIRSLTAKNPNTPKYIKTYIHYELLRS